MNIICKGSVSEKEWAAARLVDGGAGRLLSRRILEASEGRPVVRRFCPDGKLLQRSDYSNEFFFYLECEADG